MLNVLFQVFQQNCPFSSGEKGDIGPTEMQIQRREQNVWLIKKRNKYKKDRGQGKRKSVADMTKREHRQAKRRWKKYQILAVSPENVLHKDVSCTCLHEKCPEHSLCEFSLAPWGSDHKSRGHKRKQKNEEPAEQTEARCKRSKPEEVCGQSAESCLTEEQYASHLKELESAKTFTDLQNKCAHFNLGSSIHGTYRYIEQDKLEVDYQGIRIYPSDVPGPETYPVIVRADGNCLPACGSVYAFAHDRRPAEIRARIVHEMALNPII